VTAAPYEPGINEANAYAPPASVVAVTPFVSVISAPAIGAGIRPLSVTTPCSLPGVCVSVMLYVVVVALTTVIPVALKASKLDAVALMPYVPGAIDVSW